MSCSLANSGSTSASGTTVEREIPGGVPGILPLVGHRDDVGVVEVGQSWLRPAVAGRAAAAARSPRASRGRS